MKYWHCSFVSVFVVYISTQQKTKIHPVSKMYIEKYVVQGESVHGA
jgi:tetrahydromethanopterin S-methyltransferase subunit D